MGNFYDTTKKNQDFTTKHGKFYQSVHEINVIFVHAIKIARIFLSLGDDQFERRDCVGIVNKYMYVYNIYIYIYLNVNAVRNNEEFAQT